MAVLSAQRDSLRQLNWILAAAIVAPAVVFTFVAWSGYRTALDLADRQVLRARDVAREHAIKVFETIDSTVELMEEVASRYSDDSLRSDEPKLHVRLKQIVEGLPQIKSAWIFDPSGHSIANSIALPSPQIDFSDRDYFRAHVQNGNSGLFIGEVLTPRPPYGGDPFFSVSRQRTQTNGGFGGVIQISALPAYFEAFYATMGGEGGAYYALLRQDGAVLARLPKAEAPVRLRPDGPLAKAVSAGQEAGLVTALSGSDGRERRIAFVRVPGYPLYVLAGIETAAVRAAWLRWLGGLVVFGLPVTAAFIALIFLARRRTARMYAEAGLRAAAEDTLRQTQRMEALGQLTGGVAHDFNNLLMIIGGAAQQLRNQPLSDRMGRSVAMIETATKRAVSLTGKLLSFARRRTLTPRVVDIGEYVFEFDVALRQSLRPDIVLRYDGIRSGLNARVDPDELEIALINLAANARDAMPDGGELVVSLGTETFGQGSGPDGLAGDFVTLRISDTGIGISEENKARIFEPFFTTKPAGKGTGLGLSQAYGFARQSGGALTLDSAPGKGAAFTLYLPRTAEQERAVDESQRQNGFRAAPGERALLVEDNDDVAQVAADYLAQLGYRVERAANVDSALRRLRDDGFNLVVSDIVMPGGLNGLDLAHAVREHHGELPLVLASGYSDKANEALSEGFVLLRKPFTSGALAEAIESARARRTAGKRQLGG
jgi:two-component system NtrC family sensor kinase